MPEGGTQSRCTSPELVKDWDIEKTSRGVQQFKRRGREKLSPLKPPEKKVWWRGGCKKNLKGGKKKIVLISFSCSMEIRKR